MSRISTIILLCLVICLAAGCDRPTSLENGKPGSARPNVLIVMADDMGYSDVGAYGGIIDTPAIDALARGGIRFSNFYTNNMCVPTRAALLTGSYHTRAYDREAHSLRSDVTTIAEMLAEDGYATWMSGKWHLAPWDSSNTANWPQQRGFERFFGTILGAGSFFAPNSLTRGNTSARSEYLDEDFYYSDAIGEEAVNAIEAAGDRPFFGYVAFTAPHWPLHAKPEDIQKYKGRFDAGWDVLREQRYERMRKIGILDGDAALSPRHPDVSAWEDLTSAEKGWQSRRMEIYAAQIDNMDQNIGRIVDALERTGALDRTLIFFLSDNGGCHVELPPTRTGLFLPDTTRDGRPVRNGNLPEIMPGPEASYQSYGYGWANLSNTPYRLFKQFDHEGGIRTPLIVHWPERISTSGRIVGHIGHTMDIAPTILEAARVPNRITLMDEMDGRSLLSGFQSAQPEVRDTLFWSWNHGRAVRAGQWKLVAVDDADWELYNLLVDGTELNNLAPDRPALVAELDAAWETWWESAP